METKNFTNEEKQIIIKEALEMNLTLGEIQSNISCGFLIFLLFAFLFDIILAIILFIFYFIPSVIISIYFFLLQCLNFAFDGYVAGQKLATALANPGEDEDEISIRLELGLAGVANGTAVHSILTNLPKPQSLTFRVQAWFNRKSYQILENHRKELLKLMKFPETIKVIETKAFLRRKTEDELAYKQIPIDHNYKGIREISFVSHKWYGDSPDGDGKLQAQFLKMLSSQILTKYCWVDYLCADNSLVKIVQAITLLNKMNPVIHYGPSKEKYDNSLWCMLEKTIYTSTLPYSNKDTEALHIFDPEDLWIILYSTCIVEMSNQTAKSNQWILLKLVIKKLILCGMIDEFKDLLPIL